MASRERSFTEDNGTITYGTILSSYGYRYDECNNLTKLTCSVAGVKWSTVYTYDNDNRPSTTTLSSGKVITNGFDKLGRLHTRTIGLSSDYVIEIDYVDVGNSKTTGLVETYRNGSDAEYEYEYDAVGNITSITQDGTSITYEYDAANRLTRENNGVLNQTIVYDYTNDLWGNIQSKTVYPYTTGTLGTPISTVCYAYANTDWGDQLTSYNGSTITYDSMGNPTSYRGYTFGWRGKQLTSASNGTNSLTFEYNEDGLRQKKICNNISTDYYYNGSVLIGMQRGQTKYLFSYDAGGNVVSVKQGNNEYYYLRNAQGDIVKIIDAAGNPVVEYTYDTWGKKVTTTGSLAGTLGLFQPFRYRGYVYDWETGFYYLQSRYYDPTVGRFISADVLLSTGQGVLGHNCYAYCLDNPVIMFDYGGNRPAKGVINPDGDDDDIETDTVEYIAPPATESPVLPIPIITESEPIRNAIERGLSKLGTPYKTEDGSEALDCSHFVRYAYREYDPIFKGKKGYTSSQQMLKYVNSKEGAKLWKYTPVPQGEHPRIPDGAIIFYGVGTRAYHVAIAFFGFMMDSSEDKQDNTPDGVYFPRGQYVAMKTSSGKNLNVLGYAVPIG